MSAYRVELNARSERDFGRLPHDLRDRVSSAIRDLEQMPRPPGYGPARGRPGFYRVRVSKLRIIDTIDDPERLMRVHEIMPREEDDRRR